MIYKLSNIVIKIINDLEMCILDMSFNIKMHGIWTFYIDLRKISINYYFSVIFAVIIHVC